MMQSFMVSSKFKMKIWRKTVKIYLWRKSSDCCRGEALRQHQKTNGDSSHDVIEGKRPRVALEPAYQWKSLQPKLATSNCLAFPLEPLFHRDPPPVGIKVV
jgi:hypothetical protein